MPEGIRQFNERAARLYDGFVKELGRWHKVPVEYSQWNDKGTLRYREYWALQNPYPVDYDESVVNEHVQMRYILPADLVDKYIRYCAMEDAMERLNG